MPVQVSQEKGKTPMEVSVMNKRRLLNIIGRIFDRRTAMITLVGLAMAVTMQSLWLETIGPRSPQSEVLPFSSDSYVPGEFLVKPKPGVTIEIMEALNLSLDVKVLEYLPDIGVFRLKVASGFSVQQMVQIYNTHPAVEYAEPSYVVPAPTANPQALSP